MAAITAGEDPYLLSLPRFVSVRELAKRLVRNEFTIYHWIKEAPERLPRVTRFQGRVLFLDSDVRTWFEASQRQAQEIGLSTAAAVAPKRKRGRPSKAELQARTAQRGAR